MRRAKWPIQDETVAAHLPGLVVSLIEKLHVAGVDGMVSLGAGNWLTEEGASDLAARDADLTALVCSPPAPASIQTGEPVVH
jgi:hypothetical protein